MRSYVLLWVVLFSGVWGATTEHQIELSKATLSSTVSEKKEASRQLEKIANDIQKTEKEIAYLEKKIASLGQTQEQNEALYARLQRDLSSSSQAFEETTQKLEQKKKRFMKLLAEQFATVVAMEKAHEPTQESILTQEVYHAYKSYNDRLLHSLKSEMQTLEKEKQQKASLQRKTKQEIARIERVRKSYQQKKSAKKHLLERLAQDEQRYNAKLEKLVDKQNSLRSTLAKLNILHTKEVEEARKQALARKKAIRLEKQRKERLRKAKALAELKAKRAKEALKKAKTTEAKKKARLAAKEAEKEQKAVSQESEKVRNINSSYHKSKVYAYRGPKTISPIRGARLIKKFGTYIDPIYKIKIFNESITLKAPKHNAKVHNVLNGKVVFAGESSMLGKVVVVAHSGKIHTVYAGLSKIAPNIRKGRMIKKGYVIGKVYQKLLFQATKNSQHINPLKLIKL